MLRVDVPVPFIGDMASFGIVVEDERRAKPLGSFHFQELDVPIVLRGLTVERFQLEAVYGQRRCISRQLHDRVMQSTVGFFRKD